MSELEAEGPFYRSNRSSPGLRFVCTRCSACCRFDSGYVWLSDKDLGRLARGLGATREEVVSRYCHIVNIGGFRQLSLREQKNNDCVFFIDGSCSVYEHRPLQCRSFPFWTPYLASRSDWDGLESVCPGVNVGPVRDPDEIDRWVRLRRLDPPLNADTVNEVAPDES